MPLTTTHEPSEKGIKVIYRGGYIPDLAIDFNRESDFYGWLLYKHPDGQWVTLADLHKVIKESLHKENESYEGF